MAAMIVSPANSAEAEPFDFPGDRNTDVPGKTDKQRSMGKVNLFEKGYDNKTYVN